MAASAGAVIPASLSGHGRQHVAWAEGGVGRALGLEDGDQTEQGPVGAEDVGLVVLIQGTDTAEEEHVGALGLDGEALFGADLEVRRGAVHPPIRNGLQLPRAARSAASPCSSARGLASFCSRARSVSRNASIAPSLPSMTPARPPARSSILAG